jgi:hypothetical protein
VAPSLSQEWNVAGFPLSLGNVHVFDWPSTVEYSIGSRACTLSTLPVRFWHSLHWHRDMRSGSGPSYVTLSFPQLHEALRVAISHLLQVGVTDPTAPLRRCHKFRSLDNGTHHPVRGDIGADEEQCTPAAYGGVGSGTSVG